jgi:multicomponent K+:H+ antiporter subunit E
MMAPRRLLPHPALSVSLLIIWLLFFNTLSPGHVLLGALLGIGLPLLTAKLWPEPTRIRNAGLLLKFIGVVLQDIVVANWTVGRLMLDPNHTFIATGDARSRSRFIHLPLALRDEFAISILASTISLTPGTISSDLSADRTSLLIHCLDVEDEAALIAAIKLRYEAPLKEIFEC